MAGFSLHAWARARILDRIRESIQLFYAKLGHKWVRVRIRTRVRVRVRITAYKPNQSQPTGVC